jgi:hypothetical protein
MALNDNSDERAMIAVSLASVSTCVDGAGVGVTVAGGGVVAVGAGVVVTVGADGDAPPQFESSAIEQLAIAMT